MTSIVVTSGFPSATLAELRRQWDVVDIPLQREALAHLRSASTLPAAVVIGRAGGQFDASDLTAWEMLPALQSLDGTLPVIISTSTSTAATIVDLVKRGAFDYVIEPRRHEGEALAAYTQALTLAITRAVQWRQMVRENQRLRANLVRHSLPQTIQARSPQMLQVLELIRKVAPTPATVLIRGESGTGKELVAKAIHQHSAFPDAPFIAVNCGALSEELLTSELFGHARGAFTGAQSERVGLIQQAGTGTLLLDEIGAISSGFQVMLLRVLEERVARPVGSNQEYPVPCRFLAAANRDLEQMVAQGSFREDLWYRLNIFRIDLPPLRQRQSDIPVLVHFFLNRLCLQYGRNILGVDEPALALLERYHWPGNVRQLRNVLERAVIVCESGRIGLAELEGQLGGGPGSPVVGAALGQAGPARQAADYHQAMQQYERQLLMSALSAAGGNLSQAARDLGIKRTTMHYRLRQLGLDKAGRQQVQTEALAKTPAASAPAPGQPGTGTQQAASPSSPTTPPAASALSDDAAATMPLPPLS